MIRSTSRAASSRLPLRANTEILAPCPHEQTFWFGPYAHSHTHHVHYIPCSGYHGDSGFASLPRCTCTCRYCKIFTSSKTHSCIYLKLLVNGRLDSMK